MCIHPWMFIYDNQWLSIRTSIYSNMYTVDIYVIKECCHIAESADTITSPPWHPHACKDCSCKVATSSAVNVSISYSFLYWSALCLCEFLLVYLSRSCVVAFFFQLKSMVFARRANPLCRTSLACLALELLVLKWPLWSHPHSLAEEPQSLNLACCIWGTSWKKKRRERGNDQWLFHYTPIHLTKEMHVNKKNKWQNIKIITNDRTTFLIEPLLGKAVCVEECWGKFSTLTSNLEQRLPCTAFANFMHSRAHWTWAVPSPLNSLLRTVIECKGCQECTKKRRLTSYLTCKDRRVRNPQQKDIKQP